MKLVFSAVVAAGVAALAFTAAPVHAQDLLGQDVNLQYLFPDAGSLYEDDGIQTVTPGGVTFTSFGQVNTTVKPSQLSITYNVSGIYFTPSAFNGIKLSEVGASPVTITSVTVNGLTNQPGFDASRITFDANSIFVNLQSLDLDTTYNVTLDINGAAGVVPEPGVVPVALLLGGSVVGLIARKRKVN